MCGRYTLRTTPQELVEVFSLFREPDELRPRYNIAPTQTVLTVRHQNSHRVPAPARWGLIPSWSKDPKAAARMINARAETVAEKPAFRSAFKARRCLIPSDGFYEWKSIDDRKQPYHIRPADQPLFAFAGLWETWKPPEGAEPVETCTILTTEADARMRGLHDRMPVILPPETWGAWLDPDLREPGALVSLLNSASDMPYELTPVNPAVNNARFDNPACVEPVESSAE
ncbi:MAG: SOS response-associated peptidase [Planctomyces sp.]|nr:SOS response-associated peptidase [Planctomyces sp.]